MTNPPESSTSAFTPARDYNRGMDSDRRAELLKLLAEIDQGIADAKSLASDPLLWPEERAFAEAQLAIRLDAVKRVEGMLGDEPR